MKHFAATKQEVAERTKLRVVVEGEPVLLLWHDHQVFAISDRCPHLGVSLEKGTLVDGILTCKSHRAQIDITTGAILEKAKILGLKMPTKQAKVYGVEIVGGDVFITL